MAELVVDASVVAKWFIPERDHEAARALRDAYLEGRDELLAPALLPFEVVNALWYSGHFDADQLGDAARSVLDYGIELVPYRRLGDVVEIAVRCDITIYDAAYLSLARATETVVYTADERLLAAIEGTDVAGLGAHVRTFE